MTTPEAAQKILWEAVIDIAHIRASYATSYIERKRKSWRTSWTSADADRLEMEAIQQWNANHPALIALWKFQKEHAVAITAAPQSSTEDTPPAPEPRVWEKGDDEPDESVRALATNDGPWPYLVRAGRGGWFASTTPDATTTGYGLPWRTALAQAATPLSEVPARGDR